MKLKSISIILAAFFISGCVSNVHLGYTPIVSLEEQKNITVALKNFEDERGEKHEIGVVRNAYGMPLSYIKTEDNVPAWVASALRAELERAGYLIAHDPSAASYILEGKVCEAYASSWLTYTGSMKVEIVFKKGEEALFQKVYEVCEGNGVNFAMQTSSCVEALEMSLQALSKEFVADVNHAVAEKAPQL